MVVDILKIFVISILPIFELRGGIPYGILRTDIPAWLVFVIAVVANILVIPLVFFFLDYVHHLFVRVPLYSRFFEYFVGRTKRKAHSTLTKYGYIGLIIFVGIPLPVTGAYTGTLAAWIFGLDKKKSFLYIALGVLLAGAIVLAVTLTGSEVFRLFLNRELLS